mgnify:CR=1 FL=1
MLGQHNAIMAGLNYAEGDYIIGMDDDLQTHPSQIPKLIGKIEEGYDADLCILDQELQLVEVIARGNTVYKK